MIRPLSNRVLIQPIKNPDRTESGLHLVQHTDPWEQGTVVALGEAVHPKRDEAQRLATRIEEIVDRLAEGDNDRIIEVREKEALWAAASLLRDLVRKEPCVQLGDTVAFSWSVGQEVVLDDDEQHPHLILREEDLLAVLESEPA